MKEFKALRAYTVNSPLSETLGFSPRYTFYAAAVQSARDASLVMGWANIERDANGTSTGDGDHTVARFVHGYQSFGWSVEEKEMIYSLPHRGVDCPHGCPDHLAYG